VGVRGITIKERVDKLYRSIREFKVCIESLPESLFLKKIDGWAPRDITAHLIGWNLSTMKGCQQIMKGETPFYLIDPGDDFCKVNAVLVREYDSRDKKELVAQLDASTKELNKFLDTIARDDWEADFGVKYQGQPVTIKNSIDALTDDFIAHRQQIEQWAKNERLIEKGKFEGQSPSF
jgi:hypothetical protein